LAINPAKYQDYVAGRITLEQAQTGYTGPTTVNPNPVNIFDKVINFPAPVPQYVQSQATTYPTAIGVDTAINSGRDARIKEMNNNVWSNDPTAAILEQKSWAIYVDTGRWDSPEQKQYHAQAEASRSGLNPLYPGSTDGGIQNKYILPTDQFVQANGMDMKGLVTYGALGLGAVMILSMFRR
jgi:hypothetical protein